MAGLRRFNFFDRQAVPSSALPCLDIVAGTSGRGLIILGDSDGHLLFIDRDFQVSAYQAHACRVNAIHLVKGSDILLTIGDGPDSRPRDVREACRAAAYAARALVLRDHEATLARGGPAAEELLRTTEALAARRSGGGGLGGGDDSGSDSEIRGGAAGAGAGVGIGKGGGGLFSRLLTGAGGGGASTSVGPLAVGGGGGGGASGGMGTGVDLGFALGLGVPLEYPGIGAPGAGAAAAAAVAAAAADAAAVAAAAAASDGPSPPGAGPGSGAAARGGSVVAVLKVWRLGRRDERTGAPQCVRSVRLFGPGSATASLPLLPPRSTGAVGGAPNSQALAAVAAAPASPAVTALAAAEDLSQVAVGCADGLILLLRSDWLRQRGSGAVVRAQVLQEPSAAAAATAAPGEHGTSAAAAAVTFLAYTVQPDPHKAGAGAAGSAASGAAKRQSSQRPPAGATGAGGGSMLCLYAVTPSRVRCWFPTEVRPIGFGRGWSAAEASSLLDEAGAAPGCACVVPSSGELVTASDAGVFSFSPEDRTAAYGFGGRKQAVHAFRSYLLVAAAAAAAGGGGGGGSDAEQQPAAALPTATTVTLYDLRARYIGFTMTLAGGGGGAPLSGATAGTAASSSGGAKPTPQQQQPLQRLPSLQTLGGPAPTLSLRGGQQRVVHVLSEWGTLFLFVLTSAPQQPPPLPAAGGLAAAAGSPAVAPCGISVIQLSEADTATKVEQLCKMQQYETAAAVATAANFGKDGVADIIRQHADALFERGDFEAAVEQYVRTIGSLEPSYVIRLFLDSQRVPLLCTYLEALHAAGRADQAHTTLLLNCYTKLRQQDKLRAFIRGGSSSGDAGGRAATEDGVAPLPAAATALSFDVRAAIPVLRDAGCYADAIYLAELHGQHDWLLRLLLEQHPAPASAESREASGAASDGGDPAAAAAAAAHAAAIGSKTGAAAALSYITRLPFADAERYLLRYGREISTACPDEAIAVIVMMCTRYKRATPFVVVKDGAGSEGSGAAATGGTPAAAASSGDAAQDNEAARGAAQALLPPAAARSTANLRQCSAQPAVYLPLFADRPGPLKALCTALVAAAARGEMAPLGPDVWHAFLDVSLRPEFAANRDADVLAGILKDPAAARAYDPAHALLLCQAHGYDAGCVALYERLGLYGLVVEHYVGLADAAAGAGRAAEARGLRRELLSRVKAFSSKAAAAAPADPSVWLQVLAFLARTYPGVPGAGGTGPEGGISTAAAADDAAVAASDTLIVEACRCIAAGDILPPLAVVSALSAGNPALPFGLLREFLLDRLAADASAAAEDARSAEHLRADAVALLDESHRLATAPVVFQARKCRACGGELDLPSVHFVCGGLAGEEHAFHLHCVAVASSADLAGGGSGGGAPECPVCATEQHAVRAFRAAVGPKPRMPEAFAHELAASKDGFLKVAEFFSKGLL